MDRSPQAVPERLLWLIGAAAGGLLAWPTGGPAPLVWALGVFVSVVCALVPVFVRPHRLGAGRLVPTVGLAGLVASSILVRPTEPDHGLVVLVGAAGLLLRLFRRRPSSRPPSLLWTALVAAFALAVPETLAVPRLAPLFGLLCVAGGALAWRTVRGELQGLDTLADYLLASPSRVLVAVFGALCAAGTLLLLLPSATTGPAPIGVVDAAFTAVSAVCVTGLIVLDTPADFSLLGQGLVLGLIQVGGLGIMAFASLVVLTMGRRLGVREERLTASLLGGDEARRNFDSVLGVVLRVTLWTEGLGIAALTPLFLLDGDRLPMALWRATFTSISAFCNAGFSLQSDSLVPYHDHPLVLGVVGALIVVGGTGPVVVASLVARRRASLHRRLVVWTTAVLVVVPGLLFLAFEWQGVLAEMSVVDKVSNALFQSITLRTAGFNSIDFAALRPETWTLTIVCMFVGASPGSTGGGIKTTTAAVLVLSVLATIRGHSAPQAFGRRIGDRTVHEASAIAAIGVGSVILALVALQLTQVVPLDRALFEVVSALGTAGLSMGATAALDDVGKILIIACMFAGRVGPITLFVFLIGGSRSTPQVPEAPVQVG